MDTSEKASSLRLLTTTEPAWGTLYRDLFKRALDITFAILLMPFVIPILLILMILIKISSKGPAIYKSARIGKAGRRFQIFKLRTMVINADERLKCLLEQNEAFRLEWESDQKLKDDPRITRIGKIIRQLSLDEIPQIFNVLKGDMSFVGPRPIVENEISKYGNYYPVYKSVLPGVSGLWQVNGRNDTSYARRLNLDAQYARNISFLLDLKILLQTIPAAVTKKGAY